MAGATTRLWPSIPVEVSWIIFGIGLVSATGAAVQWIKDRSFTPAAHARLTSDLQEFSGTSANVEILFAQNKDQPTAQTLESIFKLAGWQANLTTVPLEQYKHEHFDGVEVVGPNAQIVRSVVKALRRAGFRRVHEKVVPHNIVPENPKWPFAERRVRITLGHQ